MTAPDRSALTHFDHWLDAMVSGMPVPGADAASDAITDPAITRDARHAARQFHGLAARAEWATDEIATTARLGAIWEDIVDTHLSPTATVTGHGAQGKTWSPRTGRGAIERSPIWLGRFQPIINGALAAALILALAAGIWRAQGGVDLGFGGGENGSSTQFAALSNQDATPATPDAAASGQVTLPTADECTVTPLTVAEVIEILKDPVGTYVRHQTADAATPAAPEATAEAERRANAIALSETGGPVPQDIMAEVAATQRQWVACVMKGSYFQKWALEYPGAVHEEITRVLPLFTSEEETRALLTELETIGSVEGLPPLTERYADGQVILVNPDPSTAQFSASADGTWAMVSTGWTRYDAEGNPLDSHPYTPDSNTAYAPWSFTLLGDNGPWVVMEVGGYRG